MSEREEIQLRGLKNIWQSRQDFAGVITLILGLLTLGVCLSFVFNPGWQYAGVMVFLMLLLVISCWRLISAAARVVEISKLLDPSRHGARLKSEIIEAEVVYSVERRALQM